MKKTTISGESYASQNPRRAASGRNSVETKVARSLQGYAETLMSQGMPEAALSVLSTALMTDPGRVPLIHKIGQCLDQTGREKDAGLCYRGTLPDSVNRHYFNADSLSQRVKSVANCVGVEYLPAFEAEKIKLDPPLRNKTEKRYNQFNYRTTEARDTFCTVAENGSIWFDGFNTLALDSVGNVIQEQIKGNEFACYHSAKFVKPIELKGTVCFLDGRSSSIYYHWILDILPKLGIVEKSGIQPESIDYFVAHASSKFQLDTLLALGIRKEQLVFAKQCFYYKADRMVVPCLRNDLGDRVYHGLGIGLGSWIPKFLQHKLGPARTADGSNNTVEINSSKPVKVYISRSARGSRNIANEPAMIEALHSRGFTTVEFERLTVAQQAELMSRAEVVVGVHGAGFTNLCFCQPGTKVFEIFGDYVVPCYWALCAVARLEYTQFMACSVDNYADVSAAAPAADNPGGRVGVLRDMEIDIDVDAFIEYLDDSLGESYSSTLAVSDVVSAQ